MADAVDSPDRYLPHRYLRVRYLARDGKEKTCARLHEREPGQWFYQGSLMPEGRKGIERYMEALDRVPRPEPDGDVRAWAAQVVPVGQRTKRPFVAMDEEWAIFDGYFRVRAEKLNPILTAVADAGERHVTIAWLRMAVERKLS